MGRGWKIPPPGLGVGGGEGDRPITPVAHRIATNMAIITSHATMPAATLPPLLVLVLVLPGVLPALLTVGFGAGADGTEPRLELEVGAAGVEEVVGATVWPGFGGGAVAFPPD